MPQTRGLSEIKIKIFLGDGAYDIRSIYEILDKREIIPNIKIRKNARWKAHSIPAFAWRNDSIRAVQKTGPPFSLQAQRLARGYGKRSLVETFFSRYKAYFGDRCVSRKWVHAQKEIAFKVNVFNRFA